jgi:hypothetical protein
VQGEDLPAVVALNVGGHRFMTRLSTLRKYPDSMLAAMFSGRHRLDRDPAGAYFLDSNGAHFGHVLEYLRHATLPPPAAAVHVWREAAYYGLTSLQDALQTTPAVAAATVRDMHRAQFPDYSELKKKVRTRL